MQRTASMTRTEHIQHAILSSLARHADALDAGVGVTNLQCCVKFDRATGLPSKAIVTLEMENFIVSRTCTLDGFAFEST